jgi:PBP1b-binding outer membrane lipoprotein LpoB
MKILTRPAALRAATALVVPASLLAAALLASACASTPPPREQMAVSTAAVADAVSSGAPEFAPTELKVAREKLDRANVAMLAEEYRQAGTLAQEAQVDAQLASSKARSVKAQKAAQAVQDDSRALRQEIERKSN